MVSLHLTNHSTMTDRSSLSLRQLESGESSMKRSGSCGALVCRICTTPVGLLQIIAVGVTFIIFMAYNMNITRQVDIEVEERHHSLTHFQMPETSLPCFNVSRATIGNLTQLIADWSKSNIAECRESYHLMSDVIVVHERKGRLKWGPKFGAKMLRWLGNSTRARDEAMHQKIVFIRNKLTGEESIFNPLRELRPKPEQKGISNLQFVRELTKKTAGTCDFCNYSSNTAFDHFGRIESKFCVTAANAFKLDGFHTLIILRNHDPLGWSLQVLTDAFNVAEKWFNRIHLENKSYIYPAMSWDLLPKSSGSQIHPHLHTFLKPDGYYGNQQHWYGVAVKYGVRNPGRNFFTDYVTIHDRMGLAIKHGTAVALTHLTPRKDNEVIVMSKELNSDFISLLYATLRTYIDVIGRYSFSMVITLPPLVRSSDLQPVMARVVTRGTAQETRSDISSMEIYAASNIDSDLFKFASKLRTSVTYMIRQEDQRQGR